LPGLQGLDYLDQLVVVGVVGDFTDSFGVLNIAHGVVLRLYQ